MSARCKHNVHRSEPRPYQTPDSRSKTYTVDEGYDEVHHRWEICDGGLIQRKMDRLHKRKRPHSTPRKKIKDNRESEETN